MEDDDLPILGEPLAIEFANTQYGEGADRWDILERPEDAGRWAKYTLAALAPSDLGTLMGLRDLRDDIHRLILAHSEGRPLCVSTVARINAHTATACAHLRLVIDPHGQPASQVVFRGGLGAQLATSCIEVLTGPNPVLRCQGPGCTLFFVQTHRRRRFCHESCSHRARQRRYARKGQ